jgi:hypothetical protein
MSSKRTARSRAFIRWIFARLHFISLFIASLMIVAVPVTYATTWNVTDEFPGVTYGNLNAANPNGDWTYGQEIALAGTFSAFNRFGYNSTYSNVPYWDSTTDTASVWKNTSANTYFNTKPGELALSPGPTGQYAVIRWTSPIAGTVSVTGKFETGDGIEYDIAQHYYIYKGNSKEYEAFTSGDGPFSLTEVVSIGTTIDFIVGPSNYFGNTPLDATINTVPLPGALWFLGSGLLGLGALRRFRKS